MAALTDFLTYLDNKLTQVDNLEQAKNATNVTLNSLNTKLEGIKVLSDEIAQLKVVIDAQKALLDNFAVLIADSQKNYEEFAKFVSDRLAKEQALR